MKLLYQITINGREVSLHQKPNPGEYWYLMDYEVRINGNPVASFSRQSTFAPALRAWEKLAGIRLFDYPCLPHCPTGGTPHWKHKRTGTLYWAPFVSLEAPKIFQAA